MSPSRRYLLISPCRDEAQYLRHTLDSVSAQSVQPAAWVSRRRRIDRRNLGHSRGVRPPTALPTRGAAHRSRPPGGGTGCHRGFYAGLKAVSLEDFDYVCKLDTDLRASGSATSSCLCNEWRRPASWNHLREAVVRPPAERRASARNLWGRDVSWHDQILSRRLFQGDRWLGIQVMWDGIDCHRARMLGWIAESVDDEFLRFVHLRPQGASQKGIWTGCLRAGFGQYFMGTSPIYYLTVASYRLPHPALIGSAAMLWGYFRSWLKGLPRYDDLEFRRFLRSYQHACLRMGKRAATARVDAERPASSMPATRLLVMRE